MIPVLHGVWAAAGGLVGDFEHIETQTVGAGGAASITFSSIPQTYKHLQIRAIIKISTSNGAGFRFNSDSGTNYTRHRLIGDGTTASSAAGTGQTSCLVNTNAGFAEFGGLVLDILDYANTNKYTTSRWLTGMDNNGSGGIAFESGLWLNTNAVTSITVIPLSGTFSQYSNFALYGIK